MIAPRRPLDGRILRLNLAVPGANARMEDLGPYRRFLGGRGVNQALLFYEVNPELPPLSPSVPVAIGAGLLCGTNAPGAYRVSLDTKNPFTGGVGSANVGGELGTALRRAGVGHLVLLRRAPQPVVVCVDDGRVELLSARSLWGTKTSEATRALRAELGEDFSILTIGPAGERGAWAACAVVDGARVAARCGIGAALGAKNVKAIAVRGTGEVEVAYPARFEALVRTCTDKLHASPFNQRRMRFGVYCYTEAWGVESPYRNFSGQAIPGYKRAALAPERFLPYLREKKSCGTCPIACWTVHEFQAPGGPRLSCESLQGNDVDNFGAKLDLDDPRDVLRAHALCNDLGLDVDVASNAIAWAVDCYQRGLLNSADTDGLELTWGDASLVFTLLEKMAYREGLGDLLADGCLRAAARVGRGTDRYCQHIYGNDLFECLWSSVAWALGTVMSPRGGTHTRGAVNEERLQGISGELCLRLFGVSALGPKGAYENKERLVVFMERLNAALDALGICQFTHSGGAEMLLPEDYAALASAALGEEVDAARLLFWGERIHTLERCFNILHAGWGRAGDHPPRWFVEVPLAGLYRLDPHSWRELLDRYYDHHGWDRRTGWPRRETLLSLGLGDAWSRLEAAGKG